MCTGFLMTFRFGGRRRLGAGRVVVSEESEGVSVADSVSILAANWSGVLGTTNRRAWITRTRGVCKYDGRES